MTTRLPETTWPAVADRNRKTQPCEKSRDQRPETVDSETDPLPDKGVISAKERVRVLRRRAHTPPRIPPEVFLG